MPGRLRRLTLEAVYPGGDGALVGEVPRNSALVARGRSPDEGRVEDQPVLGRVTLCFQGPASSEAE